MQFSTPLRISDGDGGRRDTLESNGKLRREMPFDRAIEVGFAPELDDGEKWDSSNSRNGQHRGVLVPGAFKLDHLQSYEPILFQKIFTFFTFILGGQFLLPQRTNNGKREFSQPQKRMRHWVFSAWNI